MEAAPHSRPDTVIALRDRARRIVVHLQRSEVFRSYRRAFEITTGLPLALRQAGSFQPPLHGSKQINPFCALMAQRNKSCAACLQFQQQVEDEAVRETRTLECGAGLFESAVPVRSGDTLIGYLQTGQVFLEPPTARRAGEVLLRYGPASNEAGRQGFSAAYLQTRVIAKEQYEAVLRLLAIFAQHLAAMSNQLLVQEAAAEFPAITKVRAFIAEHLTEELHLNDAARAANMSAFYFCKLFKRTTGFTFTHYLARQRIEAVKQSLFKADTRVSEAAYEAGFTSLSQFNRVFLRVAGESPSRFRERLHGTTPAPCSHRESARRHPVSVGPHEALTA